jgi:plasmid stability protein
MAVHSVTLHLPSVLYNRLKRRAEHVHRTVEAELLEVVVTAVPITDELPVDLAEAISSLSSFDDEVLWQTARSHLPAEVSAQLEALHLKRQREDLTEAETQTVDDLVHRYERTMLLRAQAAVELKKRGYDTSELVPEV